MRFFGAVSRASQALANLARDHNASMVAARAPERNGEITFALRDVMRQQIDQQVRDARDELRRLWKRPDVARHARILAGEMFERRNVIRVWKDPNLEHH